MKYNIFLKINEIELKNAKKSQKMFEKKEEIPKNFKFFHNYLNQILQ